MSRQGLRGSWEDSFWQKIILFTGYCVCRKFGRPDTLKWSIKMYMAWQKHTQARYYRNKLSKHSSIIRPVWLSGWVIVYELSGCGIGSCCIHLNLDFLNSIMYLQITKMFMMTSFRILGSFRSLKWQTMFWVISKEQDIMR